jgi:basic membrane protein A
MVSVFRKASVICLGLFALNSFASNPIKVGLVLDKGGKDDKSFNSAAFEGATKAQKEMGITLKYVEATDLNALEGLHRSFAKKNFDLIIGIGFAQTDAVKKMSAQFPESKFALVDGEIQAPNVRSLLFEEHEGSFLVGAIAALTSKTGRIGFVGGMDIPLIRRFAMGYQAGVKHINPKAMVLENYIGVSGDAWTNPAKAKELALSQYGQKVDIIFVAAGASNAGVFDAAEEKKTFAIGVDSNQNWVKPGFILTSMLKRVDVAVYETIKQVQEGHFTGGVSRFGVKEKGVDYSVDKYNEKILTADVRAKVNDIKAKIITGDIRVPDYYKLKK